MKIVKRVWVSRKLPYKTSSLLLCICLHQSFIFHCVLIFPSIKKHELIHSSKYWYHSSDSGSKAMLWQQQSGSTTWHEKQVSSIQASENNHIYFSLSAHSYPLALALLLMVKEETDQEYIHWSNCWSKL